MRSVAYSLIFLAACTGDTADENKPDDTDTGTNPDLVGYAFASRFDGADSVSTSGQVFRQLLISELGDHLGGLTDRLNTGFFPTPGEVTGELTFYFEFDSTTSGSVPLQFSSTPDPLQTTFDAVSSDKDLVGKLAGNDEVGQHQDWSTAFVGWPGAGSPELLVREWFDQIDAAAVDWSSGSIPLDPNGVPVPSVTVTAEGHDLAQLLEKFLAGAIAFSQATDDYLDDDEPGKGLLADHTVAEEGENYTALEHAWDEGFGYFGAARTYGDWDDAIIADPGTDDVDGDGAIDLLREVCWGHSTNAAKRDLGAVAPTDFSQDAWDAFVAGRGLLASTSTDLTADELATLQGHRDEAVEAWEGALAATVVHYINDVLQDMGAMGTDDYSFGDHAKHWSEMKGFALAFQFNPRSPMSASDFETLHVLLGTSPVTADASELRMARDLIGAAYGFDPANMGDDDGLGGW